MPTTWTRWRDCGPTSRTWSWPTCAATRSLRSWTRPGRASPGSAGSPGCCSRFCGTAGSSCEKYSSTYSANLFKGFYAGHRVVLVWDGLSAHWSTKLRAHLDAQHHWLRVERLPATPPAQPGRGPVGQPQGRRAGHFAGDSLAEVADQAQQGIQRVCDSDSLVLGFLAHTGLALDEEAVTPR